MCLILFISNNIEMDGWMGSNIFMEKKKKKLKNLWREVVSSKHINVKSFNVLLGGAIPFIGTLEM